MTARLHLKTEGCELSSRLLKNILISANWHRTNLIVFEVSVVLTYGFERQTP